MRAIILVIAMLSASTCLATAQNRTPDPNAPRPTIGMGSKTMESCTTDQKKYCSTAVTDRIVKECLVTNWDHITSDCQDALGTPFDGAGHGGQR